MKFHSMVSAVLLAVSFAGAVAAGDKKDMSKDIVETLMAEHFDTLATAVKAAGLIDTLEGTGPFTVFAPTDEAFAKLPAGTLDDLLKPENKAKLQDILKYHVVAGKYLAADVTKMDSAPTVLGQTLMIKSEGGHVMVNDARVLKTDIVCSNGVIHVIDSVMLPK